MGSNTSKTPRPSTSSSQASYELDQPVTIGKNGLPVPRPTRARKHDLISDYDFEVFDECATEAPNDLLLGTFWQVVEYLVITPDGDLLEEMLRMRTLYRWVTSFDIYNIESELIPPQDSPLEYFLKIQCGQGTHAELLYILCELADIPCVVIQGITKSGSYKIGGKLDKDEMASQWNAVFIEGQWRFIDVFWSVYCAEGNDEPVYILIDGNAGITRFCEGEEKQLRINEFYYLTDPDAFIWTHLPNDKDWQLLRHPLDVEEFESRLYVREMFTKMQMGIKNKKIMLCSLKSEGKPIGLEFTLPEERSHNFKFMYTLFQSRTELETDKKVDIFLERFVGFEHTNKYLRFVLRFPFTGKFQMDIFGCDIEASDSFELICTYVIECSATMENCMPFPDCPEIGWGPNPHAEKYGFVTITPNDSCIHTNNGEAEVRIKVAGNHHIYHSLKSLEHDNAALSRYSFSRFDHDEFIVNVRVAKSGEYALKIYADIYEHDKLVEDTNILNFMVMCKNDPVDVSPYPDIIGNHLGQKEGAKLLDIYPLSHPSGLIKGWDGKARLEFEVKHVGVKLFCEVFSARRNASSRMSFDKREEEGLCLFNIDMPVKGEYSINVFGIKDDNPDLIYDVYSGLINSSGYASKRVKFDDDDIIDEMPTESIHTSEKNVKIPLRHNCKFLFANICRRDARDCDSNVKKMSKIERKDSSLEVTVEDYGEYLVDVFGKDKGNSMTGIGRYIIERRDPQDTYHEDIKALMKMLKPEEEKQEEEEEEVKDRSENENKSQNGTISENEYENIDDNIYDYRDVSVSQLDKIIETNKVIEDNNNEIEDDIERKNKENAMKTPVEPDEIQENEDTNKIIIPVKTVDEIIENKNRSNKNQSEDITNGDAENVEGKDLKNTPDDVDKSNGTGDDQPTESDDKKSVKSPVLEEMTPIQREAYKRQVKQKQAEKNVKKAMKLNDLHALVLHLQIYKSTAPSDEDGKTLEAAANRAIELLKAKQYLIAACHCRRKGLLAKAIKRARFVNFDKKLDMQILVATRVLNRLNRIEHLSKNVLQLNQNVLTEMKQYPTPPRGVHQVLAATALLLGDDTADLKDWRTCKKFLYKTGKENIMRRIVQFDPRSVDREVVSTAKSLMRSFTVTEIRDVSRGAAVFYVWVKAMIREIESYYDSTLRKTSSFGSRPSMPRSSNMWKIRARRQSTIVMKI